MFAVLLTYIFTTVRCISKSINNQYLGRVTACVLLLLLRFNTQLVILSHQVIVATRSETLGSGALRGYTLSTCSSSGRNAVQMSAVFQWDWPVMVIFLVVFFLSFLFIEYLWSPRNLPPGPTKWPIVGSFPYLGGDIRKRLVELGKKYENYK